MKQIATLAILGTATFAQDLPTAAAVTEPGRTLTRPLDVVLGGGSKDQERTILVLLDASATLAGAGFAEAFAGAVAQNRAHLQKTRLGLGVIGRKEPIVVAPTGSHDEVVTALRSAIATPAGEFLNIYADIRTAAAALAGQPGERILLLATLDNGDAEDDVEQTVTALHKAKVRCEVITSEATLADSYWAARSWQEKPRGTTLTGPDNAVIDVPWGFLFQIVPANEATPAGFAMWGLSRLAAGSSGRVFLFASTTQIRHQCSTHAACLFCSGDHLPPDDVWYDPLVDQLGPLAAPRDDTLKALGGDPYFRAMIDTWRAAAEAGLVSSAPGLRLTQTGAEIERIRPGRDLDLTDSASFDRHAKRAEEAAAKASQLGQQLQEKLDRIGKGQGLPRCEASAHYLRVLLQLTRVNLITFAGWCREVAPGLFGKDAVVPVVPEVSPDWGGQRPVGVGFTNLGLCHGVRPYFAVELPGKTTLPAELALLDAQYAAFMIRWGKSQFGYALRRNGIAQFWPTFPGVAGKLPRQRPKSGSDPQGPVTPKRPPREGGASTGGSSGPTTGGGR
ncbi:MAG: hypothetical protein IPK26_03420 [Planctomycetes bacterium]|nr:hypothetical protein [Planctomycetota bacterium]